MAEIIWTEPALSDLNDIAEYIALENIVAAKQLVQTIFSKVERLETFPESGRIPPELAHLSYREVVVNPSVFSINKTVTRSLFCLLCELKEICVSSC